MPELLQLMTSFFDGLIIGEHMNKLLIPLAPALVCAIFIWIIVYMEIYRHFPHMEHKKRVELSLNGASLAAIALGLIIYIAVYLLLMVV